MLQNPITISRYNTDSKKINQVIFERLAYGIIDDQSTNGEIMINKGEVIKNPKITANTANATISQSSPLIIKLIERISIVSETDFAHILTATDKGVTITLMN